MTLRLYRFTPGFSLPIPVAKQTQRTTHGGTSNDSTEFLTMTLGDEEQCVQGDGHVSRKVQGVHRVLVSLSLRGQNNHCGTVNTEPTWVSCLKNSVYSSGLISDLDRSHRAPSDVCFLSLTKMGNPTLLLCFSTMRVSSESLANRLQSVRRCRTIFVPTGTPSASPS